MAEVSKDLLLDKLRALKKDRDVIVFKHLEQGYVGITAGDFADMLRWIVQGKIVEEAVVGYAEEDGSPIVQRKERAPTIEEVKQRWRDSGYIELFEDWLAKGIISKQDMIKLFGSEKPWL
jgi:hypothetical protein